MRYRRKANIYIIFTAVLALMLMSAAAYGQDDDTTRQVLKQGLLGAGTGAIASGASGGNAGQGALIGAGTGVIGSVLLDAMTTPSRSSSQPRRVVRQAPPPVDDDYYYEDEPEDYYYEEEPPQESGTSKVLKQGLVGAGTGALASGMSGGDAGKGALIGAGTSVIGSALLDTITQPSQPKRRVYRRAPQQRSTVQSAPVSQQNIKVQDEMSGSDGSRKKIIKKYDANGKLVSEEEVYF